VEVQRGETVLLTRFMLKQAQDIFDDQFFVLHHARIDDGLYYITTTTAFSMYQGGIFFATDQG